MTTILTAREQAILVIFYLSRLPAPKGTTTEYLSERFAKMLDFYHKRFFPQLSKKTIIELCIEVRKGDEVIQRSLNDMIVKDAKFENGGYGIDKPLGVHDINLKETQMTNPDATSLIEEMRKENLKKLEAEDSKKE